MPCVTAGERNKACLRGLARDREGKDHFFSAAPSRPKRDHVCSGILVAPYIVGHGRGERSVVFAIRGMTLGTLHRRAQSFVIGPTGPITVASGMTLCRDQHRSQVVALTSARPELSGAILLNAAAVRSNLIV